MAADPDRETAPTGPPPPKGRRVVRYGLIAVTTIFLVDAIMGDNGIFALRRVRAERQALESTVESLRLENQRLLDQTKRYREDPATIEELARRDLGMVKPGETLFIIRDRPPAPTP